MNTMALNRRRVSWADVACLGGLTAGWLYYLAIIPLFARHLPPAVAQACPAAGRITLRQLATHTSGLPRLPRNLVPLALRHPADPYAGYSTEHLYRALRKARNPAPAAYLYSNYGFGLLGHLLSHTAGAPLRRAPRAAGHRAARAHRDDDRRT